MGRRQLNWMVLESDLFTESRICVLAPRYGSLLSILLKR